MLVVEIFDGLGVNSMTVLRSHLPELFSRLVQIAEHDRDEISRSNSTLLLAFSSPHLLGFRGHAQDALASFEKIFAEFTGSRGSEVPDWARSLQIIKEKTPFLL